MGNSLESMPIALAFGHRVRLRVCGVLRQKDGILLLKHKGIGVEGFLWSPPGGGVQFGESVAETLKREFKEETGLDVEQGAFLFFHEHIYKDLHALELFFQVSQTGGKLTLGTDPELEADQQILTEIRFWQKVEVDLLPPSIFHTRIGEMLRD